MYISIWCTFGRIDAKRLDAPPDRGNGVERSIRHLRTHLVILGRIDVDASGVPWNASINEIEVWLGVLIDDRAASFALRRGDFTALIGEVAIVSEDLRRRKRGFSELLGWTWICGGTEVNCWDGGSSIESLRGREARLRPAVKNAE